MIWTSADIIRFLGDGESDFNDDFPTIIDRISLHIQLNVFEYVLPDYITNIRRITYKGKKLSPLPHRYFREAFQGAQSQVAEPYWYVYNNIGQSTIRLYPTPDENIISTTVGLWTTAIEDQCIIEFYRTPNEPTNKILPLYMRRRLLKAYVMRQCFSMENQGQNIKNSKYFTDKWTMMKLLYGRILQSLISKPRKLVIANPGSYQAYPGDPVLPIDKYGTGVRPGE